MIRPTLDAVAARAGVGRGTVSRVINGGAGVRPDKREAVLRAIKELGYVPNHAARTMVTRRTDTVALVVSEPGESVFTDPFFAGIIRSIGAALAETGLQLILALTDAPPGQLEQFLAGRHVDGVLLLCLHNDDPLPTRLAELGIPSVCGGRRLSDEAAPNVVDVDNHGGAAAAVAHLLDSGRRRIAAITGSQELAAGVYRLRGYAATLAAAGLPHTRVAPGDFGEESGVTATEQLLAAHPDLDAVFAASDLMAIGALRALRAAGRRVPDDVAVVGFDDSVHAAHAGLTSVHQPIALMGREMVRMLVGCIGGEAPTAPIILDTHLVIRTSTWPGARPSGLGDPGGPADRRRRGRPT